MKSIILAAFLATAASQADAFTEYDFQYDASHAFFAHTAEWHSGYGMLVSHDKPFEMKIGEARITEIKLIAPNGPSNKKLQFDFGDWESHLANGSGVWNDLGIEVDDWFAIRSEFGAPFYLAAIRVESLDALSDVPVPAALPLMIVGVGGFGVAAVRRSRKDT